MKKGLTILLSALICAVPTVPADASEAEAPHRFTASFLQGWHCRDWTQERWEEEFSAAKSAGFDSLILQSTFDYTREDCTGDKQDPASYGKTDTYCMFPSAVEATYHSSQNGGDALELALNAAKATGMQLWLGTVSDDIWWSYGWGAPTSYFTDWSSSNAELCSGLVTEMWERYGSDYGEQIAGWYYNNEIWNIETACSGSDNGEYARIIGENISATVAAIEQSCPGKPLMLSPFYNTDLSTPEQYGSFISDVISASGLRPCDIYAPQDGGRASYSPGVIRKWAEVQKNAVDGRLHFWINNESFSVDTQLMKNERMPIDQFREDYCATADLAEENIIFSWNFHFADDPERSSQFAEFVNERTSGDVNLDGSLTSADLVLVQKWLLAVPYTRLRDWQAADLCADGRLDVFDLCEMRAALAENTVLGNKVYVWTVDELRSAVKNAKPGDVILLAPGEYDCGSQEISLETDGTASAPVILSAMEPDSPPVLKGANTEHGYILHVTGDRWIISKLVCTNSQKGIALDNSNRTLISGCEICSTGAEAIAIRDGSSYCMVQSCSIHDTGLVSPGYGEGVYIGSSKDKTGFDFKCDYNSVVGCTFRNVAAEHVDVKEYTTGTEISGCTFYGDGMTGENYAGSFIDLKGNNCFVYGNVGYRNGNPKIVAAFEVHEQVESWGYHHVFEYNTLYMDQPYGAEDASRRMYVVDGWFSDFSVKGNLVDYGEGLVPADSREFYNSDNVTFTYDDPVYS
ncbi:MAG: DUF4434 domain-containing protein [Ruminococcus sp.]|nr:DUF4434 domain-containing protein [Ruminococcus sp.]